MKRKKKNGKLSLMILTLACLAILTFGIYNSFMKKSELNEYPENTVGIISEKYSIISRGYYVNYNYRVNDENYSGSRKLNKDELERVNVGDKYKITYSKENPKYSEISFEDRIEK